MWCINTSLWQFGQTAGATAPRSLPAPAPQPKIKTIRALLPLHTRLYHVLTGTVTLPASPVAVMLWPRDEGFGGRQQRARWPPGPTVGGFDPQGVRGHCLQPRHRAAPARVSRGLRGVRHAPRRAVDRDLRGRRSIRRRDPDARPDGAHVLHRADGLGFRVEGPTAAAADRVPGRGRR